MSEKVATVTLRWQPPDHEDLAVVARMLRRKSAPPALVRVLMAAAHWVEEHKAELSEAPRG